MFSFEYMTLALILVNGYYSKEDNREDIENIGNIFGHVIGISAQVHILRIYLAILFKGSTIFDRENIGDILEVYSGHQIKLFTLLMIPSIIFYKTELLMKYVGLSVWLAYFIFEEISKLETQTKQGNFQLKAYLKEYLNIYVVSELLLSSIIQITNYMYTEKTRPVLIFQGLCLFLISAITIFKVRLEDMFYLLRKCECWFQKVFVDRLYLPFIFEGVLSAISYYLFNGSKFDKKKENKPIEAYCGEFLVICFLLHILLFKPIKYVISSQHSQPALSTRSVLSADGPLIKILLSSLITFGILHFDGVDTIEETKEESIFFYMGYTVGMFLFVLTIVIYIFEYGKYVIYKIRTDVCFPLSVIIVARIVYFYYIEESANTEWEIIIGYTIPAFIMVYMVLRYIFKIYLPDFIFYGVIYLYDIDIRANAIWEPLFFFSFIFYIGFKIYSQYRKTYRTEEKESTKADVPTHNENVLKQMKKGDRVKFKSTLYDHWGIYIGEGDIIHVRVGSDCDSETVGKTALTLDGYISENGVISIDSFNTIAKNRKAYIDNSKDDEWTPFDPDTIVERAKSRVGNVGYNILEKNCEHFVNECRYEKTESDQVNVVKAISTQRLEDLFNTSNE